MSLERSEALWRRVTEALAAAGTLPRNAQSLTPAEIARACGDDRVLKFVEEFYYPQRYGERQGRMEADAAERLVNQIAGSAARPIESPPGREAGMGHREPTREAPAEQPLCGVCGQRRAEAKGRSGT